MLGILVAEVFAESGLLIGFFLPGDSLLFTVGLLIAGRPLPAPAALAGLPAIPAGAAIAGDQVGYLFGRRVGPRLFSRPELQAVQAAEPGARFGVLPENTGGGRSIVLARFVPVVRTFTPIVAGVSRMEYRTFVTYNVDRRAAVGRRRHAAGLLAGPGRVRAPEHRADPDRDRRDLTDPGRTRTGAGAAREQALTCRARSSRLTCSAGPYRVTPWRWCWTQRDWAREMQRFARWTNLAETTFVLPPTERTPITGSGSSPRSSSCPSPGTRPSAPATPGSSRGHTARARQGRPGVRRRARFGSGVGEGLAFAAPPLIRSGTVEEGRDAGRHDAAASVARRSVAVEWVDNGPGWVGGLSRDAAGVLELRARNPRLRRRRVGPPPKAPRRLRGACLPRRRPRGRGPGDRKPQRIRRGMADRAAGALTAPYVARQGTVLGRAGPRRTSRRTPTGRSGSAGRR